ncbi:hypothetical protein G6F46_015489 [Rhizopus delemar]|nr:hypothetical protein G6F46_015489 [Rhizopus delemar]
MIPRVWRLRPTTKGRWRRSSAIKATSAVSSATSDPAAPMAIPTVAFAIAGASLTPSPTIAIRDFSLSSRMTVTLSSGIRSPRASSMPTSVAMALATFT